MYTHKTFSNLNFNFCTKHILDEIIIKIPNNCVLGYFTRHKLALKKMLQKGKKLAF